MYTVKPRHGDYMSKSSLTISSEVFDEIRDIIVRFSSSSYVDDPLVHLSTLGDSGWAPAKHGLAVISFLKSELSRKLRPFGGNQSADAISECFRKWIDAELKCRNTNQRFMTRPYFTSSFNQRAVRRAKEYIKRVLGDCRINRMVNLAGPGPGSSFFTERAKTGQYYKYMDPCNLSFTPGSEQFLSGLVMDDDLWRRALFGSSSKNDHESYQHFLNHFTRATLGNRLTTVPKTSDCSRPICIEPGLTLMLQKGCGEYLRQQLDRRCGIHLNSQQLWHKHLVKNEWSRIATIDLSSASDTIAYDFVRYMLPHNWFVFLDSLRSEQTLLPGNEWYTVQKFSSMGNAFTFELETLIFWSLTQSVSDLSGASPLSLQHEWDEYPELQDFAGKRTSSCSVFGDDIIVTSGIEERLKSVLDDCGFSVNYRKSFNIDSPFKESCGAFSLYGKVLPVFNIENIGTWIDLRTVCNQLFVMADRLERIDLWQYALDFRELRETLVAYLPDNLRIQGPETDVLDGWLFSPSGSLKLAKGSYLNRLSRSLKKRHSMMVDQWSDHTSFVEKWLEGSPPLGELRLTQLDLSQRYYVVPMTISRTRRRNDADGDYFSQSIYSLRNGRFTGAQRRGDAEVHTAEAVISWDESLRGCSLWL